MIAMIFAAISLSGDIPPGLTTILAALAVSVPTYLSTRRSNAKTREENSSQHGASVSALERMTHKIDQTQTDLSTEVRALTRSTNALSDKVQDTTETVRQVARKLDAHIADPVAHHA